MVHVSMDGYDSFCKTREIIYLYLTKTFVSASYRILRKENSVCLKRYPKWGSQ